MWHRIIFALAILLCSCTGNTHLTEELNRINDLIQQDPVQAQLALDSLIVAEPHIETDAGLHARYILLDSFCKNKNHQPFGSDSLISIAETYYEEHGSAYDLMLSYFLHGIALSHTKDAEEVYNYHLKALEAGKNTNDHHILGKICSHLFLLCAEVYSSDKLKYADLALKHYELYGEKRFITDAKINRCIALYYNKQHEECYKSLLEVRPEVLALHRPIITAKMYEYLASVEAQFERYDSAVVHFKQMEQIRKNRWTSRSLDILAMSEAYLGMRDSALQHITLAQNLVKDDNGLKFHYFIKASVLHTLGVPDSAYITLMKHVYLNDSITSHRLNHSVPKIERDNQALKRMEAEKAKNLYTMIIVSILLASLFLFFLNRKNANIAKLNREKLQEKELYEKNQISLIKVSKIVNKIQEDIKHPNITISHKDKLELQRMFSTYIPSFYEKLIKYEGLDNNDLLICQLEAIGFTNKEMSLIVDLAPSSISTKKRRMYTKFTGKEGTASEWGTLIHSFLHDEQPAP